MKTEEKLVTQKLESIRGMKDVLPEDAPYWQKMESCFRETAREYAYQEMRFPILEPTALFRRTIGEATDIVEKEMFTFLDRDGDSLTLRPEATAGLVRALVQHSILRNPVQRLWCMGPMFRYERPQKGRYRQFHQIDVEAFGMQAPEIDVEQLLMCRRLWQRLEIGNSVRLEINSLGTLQDRQNYKKVFVDYFQQHFSKLDADSQRRLTSNPLRILDSKNPEMQELIHHAPKLLDHLGDESKIQFNKLCKILDEAKLPYVINPHLVRGLDYYCHTVYEWVTDELGAQGTVCAGGRYDSLVEQLGGPPTPAVGFAIGMERVLLLLQGRYKNEFKPDLFFVLVGEEGLRKGLILADQLRNDLPKLSIECNLTNSSFKSQFKKADKSMARYALILGDDELKNQKITIKSLRSEEAQQTFSYQELIHFLKRSAS